MELWNFIKMIFFFAYLYEIGAGAGVGNSSKDASGIRKQKGDEDRSCEGGKLKFE